MATGHRGVSAALYYYSLPLLLASASSPVSSLLCPFPNIISSKSTRRTVKNYPIIDLSLAFRHHHSSTLSPTLFSSMPVSSSSSSSSTASNDQVEGSLTERHAKKLRFIDIGANLMDERYTHGTYFGKQRHEPDFDLVLQRSVEAGVTHLILTAGTLEESRRCIEKAREYNDQSKQLGQEPPPLVLGCTVGVHPTRCQQEFVDNVQKQECPYETAQDVLDELLRVALDGLTDRSVVAIGEIGLDYDRLEFSPKDVQQEFLRRQLEVFASVPTAEISPTKNDGDASPSIPTNLVTALPLFLHNRNVGRDLLEMLKEFSTRSEPPTKFRGVVHSFDDTLELAQEIIDMGLFIGLNGCSLKTDDNLAVVAKLPLTSILLETDCPYCEIKPTHASHKYISATSSSLFEKKVEKKFEMGKMVKGRNEPCQIIQVAEVVAGVKGLTVEEVAYQCYQNTLQLYGWK